MGKRLNKKAQVSVFILIGLVIFAVAGVSFFLISDSFQVDDSLILRVSEDVRPVYEFMDMCIGQTLQNGILISARSGGHVYPLERHSIDHRSHLSDVVRRGPTYIPYWYHFDYSSLQFSSKRPPLSKSHGSNSIEEQLERYVFENVERCFNNFASFSNSYVVDYEIIDFIVTISDGMIVIESDIPTTVEIIENSVFQSFSDFLMSVDTDYLRLYNAASDISRTQSQVGFLERPVLDLISSNSGVNRVLPPYYEVEVFGFGSGDYWVREDVHNFIKQNIFSRLSSMQMLFTRNFRTPDPVEDIGSSFDEILIQEILDPVFDYSQFTVDFFYPSNSNPYIRVGSGSPVMRPDEASSDASAGFIQIISNVIRRYRFNYEMAFPIVSRVCDTTSFSGQGLCFFYALEGNIRYNEAFLPATIDYGSVFGYTSGESDGVGVNDPSQYVDREISFDVINAYTGVPVESVRVFYSCGEEIHIGTIGPSSGRTRFAGKLPFCPAGGRIILKAPNYHTVYRSFNNVFGETSTTLADFEMFRIRSLPITVYKKSNTGAHSVNAIDSDVDQIVLQISKIKSSVHEEIFPSIQTYTFGSNDGSPGNLQTLDFVNILDELRGGGDDEILAYSLQQIISADAEIGVMMDSDVVFDEAQGLISALDLIPGDYEVSLTYIIHGDPAFTVDSEVRRICLGGERREDERCLIQLSSYELPELNFPSWVVSEISFIWSVSAEDLYSKDYIRFFAADVNLPLTHDDLEKIGDSNINLNRFVPEILELD